MNILSSNKTGWLVLAAIVFQGAVLIGSWLQAQWPLWQGQAIVLQTEPVDPRSWFRGNYAQLNYSISRFNSNDLAGQPTRPNEVVYLRLAQDEQGVHHAAQLSLQPPESGVFIRGRIHRRYVQDAEQGDRFWIRFGIEAYFLPKTQALALEQDMRSSEVPALATVMIDEHGDARLASVELISRSSTSSK